MGYRTIQDTVPHSVSLAELSSDAERLYWRLLSASDTYGRQRGELAKVRASCVPLLGWSDVDVAEAILELVAVERVVYYEVDGKWWVQISAFDENQAGEFLRKRGSPKSPSPAESRNVPDEDGLRAEWADLIGDFPANPREGGNMPPLDAEGRYRVDKSRVEESRSNPHPPSTTSRENGTADDYGPQPLEYAAYLASIAPDEDES